MQLHEYADSLLDLEPTDARWIESQLRGQISIRPKFGGSGYVLNPGQFAGVVALPSGARLECLPKVPIANFFYMLAVAFDLEPDFRQEQTAFQQIDEVFEFVIRHFAELVERRIDHGLYRNYQERDENLTAIRGRIATRDDMRLNHVLRHRTYCRFSEFTWDIPENQIIRQVAFLVSHWVTSPNLRRTLVSIDRTLFEVTPTQMAASAIGSFTYHRLNNEYEPIHRLCRLFLEGSTLSELAGGFQFRAFLFDMNKLFERFVCSALRSRIPEGLRVHSQKPEHLDRIGSVEIKPDILVMNGQLPSLVADTKYVRIGPGDGHHSALYQVLAYCTALNVEAGALIYPRHELDVDDSVAISNSRVRIRRLSIDLHRIRSEIDGELERMTDNLLQWSGLGQGPESIRARGLGSDQRHSSRL